MLETKRAYLVIFIAEFEIRPQSVATGNTATRSDCIPWICAYHRPILAHAGAWVPRKY